MPEEYRAFVLCREFHWTEDEYLDTTYKFCEDAIGFLNVEAKVRAEQAPNDGQPRHVHIESG